MHVKDRLKTIHPNAPQRGDAFLPLPSIVSCCSGLQCPIESPMAPSDNPQSTRQQARRAAVNGLPVGGELGHTDPLRAENPVSTLSGIGQEP